VSVEVREFISKACGGMNGHVLDITLIPASTAPKKKGRLGQSYFLR
jgi:hypothetical protein